MTGIFLLLAALDASAQDFQPLHAASARASSFLRSNWNKYNENYHPNYILDGDPKTAWVEGAAGQGDGEWVAWSVSRVTGVHRVRVRVRNGYQKSIALLHANAAPAQLKVSLLDGRRVVHASSWSLDRRDGWQELILDPPADVAFDGVQLEVEAVHPGKAYADLCISDAQVAVDADAPYNAPFENAKKQALAAWVSDRREAAAAFANLPTTWPFVSTHFASERLDVPEDQATAALSRLEEASARASALIDGDGAWYRIDSAAPRLPDGLDLPPELGRWLSLDIGVFEAAGPWRRQEKGQEGEPPHEGVVGRDDLSNARIVRRDDGTLKEAAFHHHRVVIERSVLDSDRRYHLAFDEAGRLARITSSRSGWAGEGCDSRELMDETVLTRDGQGRIARVERLSLEACLGCYDGCDPGTYDDKVERFDRWERVVMAPTET